MHLTLFGHYAIPAQSFAEKSTAAQPPPQLILEQPLPIQIVQIYSHQNSQT